MDEGTCFVIQPFDEGRFDKRYRDTFEPAIREAGLAPYRVDEDPSVSIPISEIEKGIRLADVCFAEITTDNPNVWFELGFAIAVGREVVMACAESERKSKYPFDVQHRTIVKYGTDSASDYGELRRELSERLRAVVRKQQDADRAALPPEARTTGMTKAQLVALVALAETSEALEGAVDMATLQRSMGRAGVPRAEAALALRMLLQQEFVSRKRHEDINGREFCVYGLTTRAVAWMLEHHDDLPFEKPELPDDGIPAPLTRTPADTPPEAPASRRGGPRLCGCC